MKIRQLLACLLVSVVGLTAVGSAQTVATQATVARVTGTVAVTLPDGNTVALTAGMKVPQGATITTGIDGDVYLESHAGYVTTIKAGSVVALEEISVTTENGQVKQETTLLDLKSGDLVAKLDPKKKAVNNYQVRTPQGVAAARGTTFTVRYKGGVYTIAVVNGGVLITPPKDTSLIGNANGVRIEGGSGFTTRNGVAQGNAEMFSIRANTMRGEMAETYRELLAVAVATVAVAAQNGIGGTTAAEAASVASAVFAAVPAAAEQAGALLKQSGVSSGAVFDAVKATVPAAAQGAFDSGASTGTFTPSVKTTSTSKPADATAPTKIDAVTISRSN